MKQGPSYVSEPNGVVADQLDLAVNGEVIRSGVGSPVNLPKLRYTLPDFDSTLRGKLMQMVVDHLHKRGD